MGLGRKKHKAEHAGGKNGGGHWGVREEAKFLSTRIRRLNDQEAISDGMEFSEELPKEFKLSRSRIMYIENKSDGTGLEGPARIGRVYFSKSSKTLYYRSMKFQSLKGSGFKANYFEVESGDHYWISGPRKDCHDGLYSDNNGAIIDDDIAEEYRKMLD